jgi:hypothetical protein
MRLRNFLPTDILFNCIQDLLTGLISEICIPGREPIPPCSNFVANQLKQRLHFEQGRSTHLQMPSCHFELTGLIFGVQEIKADKTMRENSCELCGLIAVLV